MAPPVKLSLMLEGDTARAGAERLRLLEAVERAGSITGAGKFLGLSYRGAWNSVQGLNMLFGVPLIEASMGGAGGGGCATLTRAGRRLKADLAELEAELQDVAARLAARMIAPEDEQVVVSPLEWMGRIETADGAEMSLLSDRGTPVVALGGTAFMRLGGKAAIVIPPSAVLLTKAWVEETSARNQWRVRVVDRSDRGEEVSLTLQLGTGDHLQSSVTRGSADHLGLMPSAAAVALVKASQVIVRTN